MSARTIPADEKVIVALDVPDMARLQAFLDRLQGRPRFFGAASGLFPSTNRPNRRPPPQNAFPRDARLGPIWRTNVL